MTPIREIVSCLDGYDPDALHVDKAREAMRACITPIAADEKVPVRAALGRVNSKIDRPHVLIDASRESLWRRTVILNPCPIPHRPRGGRQVASLPEGDGQQPQHHRICGLCIPGVNEPLRGELGVALRKRMLRGGHEALNPVGGRVGP